MRPGTSCRIYTILLALTCHLFGTQAATVVANSQLQSCVQASQVSGIACTQKLVTTLALPSGDTSLDTQELQYSVPCINSPDGVCPCSCNYASDASCTCRDLEQTIDVQLAKSPVYSTYPLTYAQSFNYHPTELTISTGGSVACYDGALSTNPTCGWATDVNGNQIANSQGFCCTCSLSQLSASTIGTTTSQQARGTISCNLFQSFLGNLPGGAHCLRFDPLYYQGYYLGPAQMQFEIGVEVTTTSSGSNTTQSLTITPSTPTALSEGYNVSAQLLGDLASYSASPDFEYSMLMIPSPTGVSPDVVLSSNTSQWMMLDVSYLTLDGSQCNLVGTSYAAFEFQSSRCNQVQGSCLNNQLYDLYTADMQRIAAGFTPVYFVSRYGGGLPNAQQAFYPVAGGPLWFGLPVIGITNSLVTLSVAADSLALVTNESPGKILSAQVCQFINASCGTFEALSQHGYMNVDVQNTGTLSANYQLTVASCSSTVSPIVAQDLALAPSQSQLSTFSVYVQSAAAANLSCTVTLLDSQGIVTDSQTVLFSTSATQFNTPVNQSQPAKGNTPSPASNTTSTSKGTFNCAECLKSLDMLCYIEHKCWSAVGKYLLLLAAALLVGSLVVIGVMRGWWLKLAWKCCRCVLSRGSKAKKKKLKSKGDQPGISSADSETSQETKEQCARPSSFWDMLHLIIVCFVALTGGVFSTIKGAAMGLLRLPSATTSSTGKAMPDAKSLSEQRLLPSSSAVNALFQPGLDVELTPHGKSRNNPVYTDFSPLGASAQPMSLASPDFSPLGSSFRPAATRISTFVSNILPARLRAAGDFQTASPPAFSAQTGDRAHGKDSGAVRFGAARQYIASLVGQNTLASTGVSTSGNGQGDGQKQGGATMLGTQNAKGYVGSQRQAAGGALGASGKGPLQLAARLGSRTVFSVEESLPSEIEEIRPQEWSLDADYQGTDFTVASARAEGNLTSAASQWQPARQTGTSRFANLPEKTASSSQTLLQQSPYTPANYQQTGNFVMPNFGGLPEMFRASKSVQPDTGSGQQPGFASSGFWPYMSMAGTTAFNSPAASSSSTAGRYATLLIAANQRPASSSSNTIGSVDFSNPNLGSGVAESINYGSGDAGFSTVPMASSWNVSSDPRAFVGGNAGSGGLVPGSRPVSPVRPFSYQPLSALPVGPFTGSASSLPGSRSVSPLRQQNPFSSQAQYAGVSFTGLANPAVPRELPPFVATAPRGSPSYQSTATLGMQAGAVNANVLIKTGGNTAAVSPLGMTAFPVSAVADARLAQARGAGATVGVQWADHERGAGGSSGAAGTIALALEAARRRAGVSQVTQGRQ